MYRIAASLALVAALAACGVPAMSIPDESGASTSDFVAALEEAGAEVVESGSVEQVFFQVPGRIFSVDGFDVQVFEYADKESRETDSALIAPDGSSIGTSMVTWIAAPTFWAESRLIVLGLGLDDASSARIRSILGDPVAGG